MLRSFQFALDKRLVGDHLRGDVGEFAPLPRLDLLAHGPEVALHTIHADRDAEAQKRSMERCNSGSVRAEGNINQAEPLHVRVTKVG